jgi:putative DNA primase/helicase
MVVEFLRGLMLSMPQERRDARWHSRFAEIPRLVSSATEKKPDDPAAWPDPVPLPTSLLPVVPVDYDMMPTMLRGWAKDVSERMQCPPDYPSATMITALAAVLGRKVAVRPKREDDWAVIANIWGMLIGPPGVMKSPAQDEGLRPLRALDASAREEFVLAKTAWDLKDASAKAHTDNNRRIAAKTLAKDPKAVIDDLLQPVRPPDEEPVRKRYVTSNATYEALAVIMQQNPNGTLLDRDELLSLLDRLDEEGHADERGFYLSGWNGNSPYTVDRIGRGLDMYVKAVCISMIGGTQPARISQYLTQVRRGGRGNDGLIARFGLMVWPDISPAWKNVDRWPDSTARKTAVEVFKGLDEIDWRKVGARRDRDPGGDEEGLPYLRLSQEAHDRFVDLRTDLEHRLRQGEMDPMLESHLAKYRKLVPSLALIVHLVDIGHGEVSDSHGAGTRWAAYLESHAGSSCVEQRCGSDAAHAIIAKVRSGTLSSSSGPEKSSAPSGRGLDREISGRPAAARRSTG